MKNLFATLNIYANMKIKLIIKNIINLFCPISDKLKKLIEKLLVRINMKRIDNAV